MKTASPLVVRTVGSIAADLLASAPGSRITGVTSRGVFLQLRLPEAPGGKAGALAATMREWVIFLSAERWRGPLSLNLELSPGAALPLAVHTPVEIQPGSLFFPTARLELVTTGAAVWQAPEPALAPLSRVERLARLQAVIQQVLFAGQESSLVELLSWAAVEAPAPPWSQASTGLQRLWRLKQACNRPDSAELVESLGAFQGLGAGLTPAGDDLINGFLLALGRWKVLFPPGLAAGGLQQSLPERAAAATTSLAASLTACASLAQSDERLVLALDGLVTGVPAAGECAALLASYGRTSGFDALIGMAAALAGPSG